MLVLPPLLQAELIVSGGHLALVPVPTELLLPLQAEVVPPLEILMKSALLVHVDDVQVKL